jgi:hypothetical protein
VDRLDRQVEQHMIQPYNFVCLDDSPFPGWWAKISLFEPGRFEGRVLYLDLDVTVTGPLDDLADHPATFAIIDDWNRRGYNSSVMAWSTAAADHIFTEFDASVMGRLHGDQNWIEEIAPMAAVFPLGSVVSYKKTVARRGAVPPNAQVVVFHGFPKSWDLPPDHPLR